MMITDEARDAIRARTILMRVLLDLYDERRRLEFEVKDAQTRAFVYEVLDGAIDSLNAAHKKFSERLEATE